MAMDPIQKLLNVVVPIFTLALLIFLWPAEVVFRLFRYLVRSGFPENLAGKVVLITGASSGIGEYLAYEYAKRGARLALIARREEQLQAVAAEARAVGSPDVLVVTADVSKLHDCKRFVDATIGHFGTLDHLVNNAGICLVEDGRCVSEYASVMDINFWGSIYTTQFAVPHLRKTKGKISVISSAAGWLPVPRLGIYCASKAALISFFETLRVEVGSEIGITIVTPGLIQSLITNDEWLAKANLKWVPMASTKGCARAIVDSTSRGDEYLTEPPWWRVLFLVKIVCPNMLKWLTHFLTITLSNNHPPFTSKSD